MFNSTKTSFSRLGAWCFAALFCLMGLPLMAQKAVTGRVTSSVDGTSLVGVAILEKGTSNGTVTDVTGIYTINVPEDAILEFSYVGMMTQEVAVRNQQVLNVVLQAESAILRDVVVSATRMPVRRLETTTAVEVIDAKQLERTKPEGIFEAVQNVPGLFVNTSQGRRGFVTTRGFPDGSPTGGLVYTGIMLDGIPTFGTPGKLPEAGFGFDLNVERVEVVRGSAATLYGRASAAGVINLISRTGGDQLGGTVRLTYYDDILGQGNFNYRADFNLNGPITDNIRFNIGGWVLNDNGFRNTGFNDEGAQVRANIDFKLPQKLGNIRVYGMYSNFNFQNLTDVAVNPATMELDSRWKNTDTYQSETMEGIEFRIREGAGPAARDVLDANGQPIIRSLGDAMADGSYGRGGHIGAKLNFELGNGFSLENHFRYQRIESGVKYGFALPSFYSANGPVLRLFLDGDAEDTDIINELRLNKYLEIGNSKHNFSIGGYFSTINLLPTTYSYLHGSTVDPNNIQIVNPFAPGAPAPTTGSITRRGEYDERVTAFFVGDEMRINNRLIINVGARYDWLYLDMEETKNPFDSLMVREERFQDWSASIGANYLLTERSAVYGNVNRAFRMPDYSAFTSLERNPTRPGQFLRAPDGIEANEVILNMEAGYRNSFGDVSMDIAGFFTNIDNRLASIFEDGLLVSKPLGQNRIVGSELTLTYAPQAVKGLLLRSSFTYQDARFADFEIPLSRNNMGVLNVDLNGDLYGNTIIEDGKGNNFLDLKGNRLPGVPDMMWNVLASYDHQYFGLNFSSNMNFNRYADATNVLELGTLSILNAGAYARLPYNNGRNDLQLGIQVRNLLNATSIQGLAGTADNDTVLFTTQRNPTYEGLLAHGYVQLPRRILVTLTANF